MVRKPVSDKLIGNNVHVYIVTCGSCIYVHLIAQHVFTDKKFDLCNTIPEGLISIICYLQVCLTSININS